MGCGVTSVFDVDFDTDSLSGWIAGALRSGSEEAVVREDAAAGKGERYESKIFCWRWKERDRQKVADALNVS